MNISCLRYHICYVCQGKHFAKFKIRTCCPVVLFAYVYCRIGVMRPIGSKFKSDAGWTSFCPLTTPLFKNFLVERTPEWESNIHCCLYYDMKGTCEYSDWKKYPSGHGMKGFDIYDGELGLLLDLDEGTLSVYKNGVRLGTMMSGLFGEYTWCAQILSQANGRPDRQNVRIERAPLPTSLSGYDVTDESSHTEDGARKNISKLMKNLKT